jgi:hypothetical protein
MNGGTQIDNIMQMSVLALTFRNMLSYSSFDKEVIDQNLGRRIADKTCCYH